MEQEDGWDVEGAKDHEILEAARIYSHDASRAQILTYRRNENYKREPVYYLQSIDLDKRQQLFDKDIFNEEYKLSPFFSKYLPKKDKVLTVGNYAPPKGKNRKSLGIFFQTHDEEGNQTESAFISWEEDFSKFLDVNAKGRLKGGGYIMIHDIINPKNGRIYLIGEKFRFAPLSLGQPIAFLEDIFIFELDEDLKLADIKVFEKKKSEVYFPKGYVPNNSTSQYMKDRGWYNYVFSQTDESENSFVIAYESVNGAVDENTGPLVEFIICDEENNFSKNRVDLNTKANYTWVKPAKAGFVSIWEFHAKEKRIRIKLEPIGE